MPSNLTEIKKNSNSVPTVPDGVELLSPIFLSSHVASPRKKIFVYGWGLVLVFVICGGFTLAYYFRHGSKIPKTNVVITKTPGAAMTTSTPAFLQSDFMSATVPAYVRYHKEISTDGKTHQYLTLATGRTVKYAVEQYETYFKNNNWQYDTQVGTASGLFTVKAMAKDVASSVTIQINENKDRGVTFILIEYIP